MTTIIDGKKIQKEILAQVKERLARLPFQPVFCDVLVGAEPVSMQYVKIKARMAEEVGIKFHSAFFPGSITTEELVREIKSLNQVPHMSGIVIQLPLPLSIDRRTVLDSIDPSLDVDCLGAQTGNEFYNNKSRFGFPAAMACMEALDSLHVELQNKSIVVLGQGELVGKPVTALLKSRNLNPRIINSQTENAKELIKGADIIISGIGRGKYITGEMIKEGAILIDAGTSEDGNAVVGDVDVASVSGIASALSPVPGGVGPITVAMLLKNVLTVAENLK